MRRIEMLDQKERHAGAGGEHGEQPPEGIEATRRGAEPDDRKAVAPEWRAAPRRRMPAPRCASRSDLSRTLSCHDALIYHEALYRCDTRVTRQGSRRDEEGALP
jgi:hypothetical protein